MDHNLLKDFFKTLADSNRLRIIHCLTGECRSVRDISKEAGISQPLTSHHLKILREAGIAKVERRGTSSYY